MDNPVTASTHQQPFYAAYLVRLWQDSPGETFRASAQSVQSGEVVRFGSLRSLFTFLETESSNIALQDQMEQPRKNP